MAKAYLFGAIAIILLLIAGCTQVASPPINVTINNTVNNTNTKGILSGTISIGPLCPVQTDPPQPGCTPTRKTYETYPVGVYQSSVKIADIIPNLDGTFTMELDQGKYQISLEHGSENPAMRSNLPIDIKITAGQTSTVDININTGIA